MPAPIIAMSMKSLPEHKPVEEEMETLPENLQWLSIIIKMLH